MKLSLKQLRGLISEAILGHSVPDWIFVEALDKFVEVVRQQLVKYVLEFHSKTPQEKDLATNAMNTMIKNLKDKFREEFEFELEQFKNKL